MRGGWVKSRVEVFSFMTSEEIRRRASVVQEKGPLMEHIKYREDNGIGWITISRPEVLNALNQDVLHELIRLLTKLQNHNPLRVLVITGEGMKSFVAGADIAAMKEMSPTEAFEFAGLGQCAFSTIDDFPRPVIAAVNGFALGGGLELALACDFIVASENAQFGQPEVKLGIIPGFGGTQRLMRQIGMRPAKELIFTGKMINAHEALRIGLVNYLVPQDSLISEVTKIASEMATKGPYAITMAKQAMNSGFDADLPAALHIERQAFAMTFDTEDQKEGCAAFLEKRKPNFKGK